MKPLYTIRNHAVADEAIGQGDLTGLPSREDCPEQDQPLNTKALTSSGMTPLKPIFAP